MAGSIDRLAFENVWERESRELMEEAVEFWTAHGALPRGEAERRAGELAVVARGPGGGLVAVSTAVRRFNRQIGHDFYYYRAFVAPKWRRSHIARELTLRVRKFFNGRFDPGDPEQPIGLFAVVENPGLRQTRNEAVWPRSQFVFIGRTKEGHHKRVSYFDGARISPVSLRSAPRR